MAEPCTEMTVGPMVTVSPFTSVSTAELPGPYVYVVECKTTTLRPIAVISSPPAMTMFDCPGLLKAYVSPLMVTLSVAITTGRPLTVAVLAAVGMAKVPPPMTILDGWTVTGRPPTFVGVGCPSGVGLLTEAPWPITAVGPMVKTPPLSRVTVVVWPGPRFEYVYRLMITVSGPAVMVKGP